MATTRTEEYLETIFKLQQHEGSVSISQIADHLGLSVPSASEMAKKLKKLNLISAEGKRVLLTPEGTLAATKVVRRHRLLERLLADELGVAWEDVHEEACKLEHGVSDAVEEKLAQYLGQPKDCPHGHPIPDTKGAMKPRSGVPLSELAPGGEGLVAEVPEENSDVLKYLERLHLKPGALVRMEERAPFEGPLLVVVEDKRHAISRRIAELIRVVPERGLKPDHA